MRYAGSESWGGREMTWEEFLGRVPIFESCTPEEISSIAAVAQEHSYAPGQIIVTQGTPGQAFYLFGEMSLLDSAPRSATIRAIDETRCLMLSSWDFKGLIERSPSIAIKLLEVLSRRLRVADERLTR
jgi:CRP-like cAMP-binding protein